MAVFRDVARWESRNDKRTPNLPLSTIINAKIAVLTFMRSPVAVNAELQSATSQSKPEAAATRLR